MVLFLFLRIVSGEFMHCSHGLSPSASACVVAIQRNPLGAATELAQLPIPSFPPQGMMMGPSAPPPGALIPCWCCPCGLNIAIALWGLCTYAYASYSVVSILCGPLDYSPPGSSVHGIFQARILEWIAISSSRGSSQPRDQTCISCVSCILGGFFYLLSHQGSLWSLVTWKPKQCSWLGSHNTLWEEFLWLLPAAALQYRFVGPGQETRG